MRPPTEVERIVFDRLLRFFQFEDLGEHPHLQRGELPDYLRQFLGAMILELLNQRDRLERTSPTDEEVDLMVREIFGVDCAHPKHRRRPLSDREDLDVLEFCDRNISRRAHAKSEGWDLDRSFDCEVCGARVINRIEETERKLDDGS